MKKIALTAAIILGCIQSTVYSQAVVADNFDRLQITYKTPTPDLQMVGLSGIHVLLSVPGYISGGEVGAPALPIRSDIIEVPFCDYIVVTVKNAVYDTLQLSRYMTPYPQQPSRFKSDTTRNLGLVVDQKIYETDALYGLPLAEVEVIGIARDRRLAQLRYSPVQVNPVTGEVVVCRSADITVSYVNPDADHTIEHYRRYHSPAFSVGTTLNNLYASQQQIKQSENQTVRMVIAVPTALRCNALKRFAYWKRSQGLLVDLLYYQYHDITTNTELAAYLKSLYDSATVESPAPTFLLLVGDHNQLPAFDSELPYAGYWSSDPGNDHITDLYFVTWTTGDNLPDCYQGRFSATDTTTLTQIINKTMLYEQYAFEDDAYLARAVLIAGEDNAYHNSYDYAWNYADPTMDYIAYNYVNAAGGYTDVTYYKNDTSYAPTGVHVSGYCSKSSAATALRSLYNTGIGWVNYSAHGDWDKWHKPNFTVTQTSSMTNNGKPSIMIGNCCLSCKFDKANCFGEGLLRKGNNAGAVAYVGATNSTLWTEDVYWSLGIRNNITHRMAPNYDAQHLGIYDRLFHTHNEAIEEQATTMGAIIYYGNLSVNASSSSANMKKYYWEIYELLGDPSLLPWMGRAADLTLSANRNGNQLQISTLPHTYVALVDTSSYHLVGAVFTDANGVATITIPDDIDTRDCLISATCQNHKPYSHFYTELVGIQSADNLPAVVVYPNPASDHVTIDGLPANSTVQLYDMQGRLQFTTTHYTFSTENLPSGLYLIHIQTPEGVTLRKLIKK